MSTIGLIPARYASSRFPGKPLALIGGIPMIQRVYENARQARLLDDVWIVTDDERIVDVCQGFGARAEMTDPTLASGTERAAVVAEKLKYDLVVNIQGDEPLIRGFVIDSAVEALKSSPSAKMSTIAHAMETETPDDLNRVKVVINTQGYALYFSRSQIPAQRDSLDIHPTLQHVGLYVYRRDFLLEYVKLEPTPLEKTENLEQLRVLEHGHPIRVVTIDGWSSCPVDVPSDVQTVETLLGQS